MNDIELMNVLNTSNNLLEDLTCLGLLYSEVMTNLLLAFNDIIEKLPSLHVLHYQEQLFRSLYYFVQLDDTWMPN